MPTYPVHGVVLDSITHQPLARALVDEQSDAALTDSNGRFELQLPAQTVTITARRPGYEAQDQGLRTFTVSANTPDITFQLVPHAVIIGRIETPDDADASGIQIMAYRSRMRHGARTWEFAGAAGARSDGSFRLIPPQTGVFMLRTSPLAENNDQVGQTSDRTKKVFGFPSVAYPAVAQQEGGLKLGQGQQLNVNMAIARQEFHAVTISVRDVPEGLQPNLQLFDEDGMPLQMPVQWSGQSRRASARLPDGQYAVSAEVNGRNPLFGRADLQVAGAALADVGVTILPLLPIPVNVHHNFVRNAAQPGSLPLSGRVFDRAEGAGPVPVNNPGISVNLESVNGQPTGASLLQRQPGSADNAALQLTGTQPGRYWVQVYPQEGYISAITSGGVDLAREPLVVGPGGASQPIDITVRNDPGQIGCTVRSGSLQSAAGPAAPMAFVYAIPQPATTQMPPQGGAPLNQEALLPSVAPGTYRVIALDQSINVDDVDKADLDRYLSRGQTVTVEAGGKAAVTLSLSSVNDNADAGDGSVPRP